MFEAFPWRTVTIGRTVASGQGPDTYVARYSFGSSAAFAMLLAAVVSLAMGCGATQLAGGKSSFAVGFNDAAGPSSYVLQTETGAPVRRVLVGWNNVQPTADHWDWRQTDVAYKALLKAHLRPLFVALAPPCWAHPSRPCVGVDYGNAPPDPAYDGAWSEFISRLAERYPDAVGIEIWNEENISPEWLPYPNAARYTQLLKMAYRAVKRVDSSLPVISGGLFASPVTGSYGMADAQFLAGMYASGAKGFMDGIGIHFYPQAAGGGRTSPRSAASALEQTLGGLRAVRNANHDSATPIWITEMGVSTQASPGSGPVATEAQQAADLLEMIRDAEHDRDVRAAIIHRLLDPVPTPGNQAVGTEPGFGVFRSDGRPKLSACALSRELHASLRC